MPEAQPPSLSQTRSHGFRYLGDVHHGVHLFPELSVFQPHLAEPVGSRGSVFLYAWSLDVTLAQGRGGEGQTHADTIQTAKVARSCGAGGGGGGCIHDPTSLVETQVSSLTHTAAWTHRHTETCRINRHRHRIIGGVGRHLFHHTWVCMHIHTGAHGYVAVQTQTHSSPHVLMAASSLRWCLRAALASFLRVCL